LCHHFPGSARIQLQLIAKCRKITKIANLYF
jgi:hypothetical protein